MKNNFTREEVKDIWDSARESKIPAYYIPTYPAFEDYEEAQEKAIIKTEDGFGVTDDDEVYVIDSYWNKQKVTHLTVKTFANGKKFFKVKENAEKFIDLHAPKYSKQDIMEAEVGYRANDGTMSINKDKLFKK